MPIDNLALKFHLGRFVDSKKEMRDVLGEIIEILESGKIEEARFLLKELQQAYQVEIGAAEQIKDRVAELADEYDKIAEELKCPLTKH